MNEAITCRKYVVPRLIAAGWDTEPSSYIEQKTFTDGRILVLGNRTKRGKKKRCDYLLRLTRDFPLAVVEAKAEYKNPSDGLQQAKIYAQWLDLNFAYSTNGEGIVEFDFLTGKERLLDTFPTPQELWSRQREALGLTDDTLVERFLTPYHHESGKSPRYYQEVAINRTVAAVLRGDRRLLLTMATGTGKTVVAFQMCWKLWSSRWNREGTYRRPKILFLADRNFLVDDPKDKTFAPFGDARWKIENGVANFGREMYFATYQSIAEDKNRPGLYREYAPDFFDLIIVDECHRGSARDDSNWHEILEYFAPATQLGMTATPLRDDNRDTYEYFGDPIYTYSLHQGIKDGFLAPYRVHRVMTSWDAVGWRPSQGDVDRYGNEIPDGLYGTAEFERVIALRARTEAIAKHLAEFMRQNGRLGKTLVFCVNQEHADEMRRALNNLNADLVKQYPDYVCRVTSDEGAVGRTHLSDFRELESVSPVILTTSQLLTTGVDAPTCRNVVLARVVTSMTEFKQIIGRGTRVRDDYGKLYFSILDYTGSATRLFSDPAFDGYPVKVTEEEIDDEGESVTETVEEPPQDEDENPEAGGEGDEEEGDDEEEQSTDDGSDEEDEEEEDDTPHKFWVDGGQVEIATHLVYELDADGKQLRMVRLTDYTAEKVRTIFPNVTAFRECWVNPVQRAEVVAQLEERGIDFNELAKVAERPDADPFDLLCHLAYDAPLRTRRQRADRLKQQEQAFFEQYGPEARAVLNELLDKYADHGTEQLVLPDVLRVAPLSAHGSTKEIAGLFGGGLQLKQAVQEMQSLLYAA